MDDLPKLQEGWVRCIHYIRRASLNAETLDSIRSKGFIYSGAYDEEYHNYFAGSYGTIDYMARAYSDPADVDKELAKLIEPPSDFDDRFIGGGALIFDMPSNMHRLHMNMHSAPGVVDTKYFRAIYHPNEGLEIINAGEISVFSEELEGLRQKREEHFEKKRPFEPRATWKEDVEFVQCGPDDDLAWEL